MALTLTPEAARVQALHRQGYQLSMLLPKVEHAIRRFELIRPGERVLVALSGGPDSVALSQALVELASTHDFELHLAHLNHRLREAAEEDEAFCVRWAQEVGVPLATHRIDVARAARRHKSSIEEQARNSRYDFLTKAAARWHCDRIAVGHTRDDQAETFLLRLLRGSGVTGLAAMRPNSLGPVTASVDGASLIRPMLDVTRSEVLDFLESRRLPYRQDPSNEDRSIARNLVRHETLPLLAGRHNPNLVATLARTAELLREDEEWMEREAARALEDLTRCRGRRVCLPVPGFGAMHPALRRRVVRGAITLVRGDLRAITARHVEDVLELAAGRSGRRLCLPGLACGRSFDELWFEQDRSPSRSVSSGRLTDRPLGATPEEGARSYNGYEYALAVPGELAIPEAGGAIRVEETEALSLPEATGYTVKVALREVDVALKVRSPAPGDRFRPLGAPGSKSVSRYLMERRVDRDRRKWIPLVVRSDEEILWVAGYGISEASRVQADASRVLRLSWLAP